MIDPRLAVLNEYFRIPLEFESITPERLLELLDAAVAVPALVGELEKARGEVTDLTGAWSAGVEKLMAAEAQLAEAKAAEAKDAVDYIETVAALAQAGGNPRAAGLWFAHEMLLERAVSLGDLPEGAKPETPFELLNVTQDDAARVKAAEQAAFARIADAERLTEQDLRTRISEHLLTHVGGDESMQWQAGHNYAMKEAARLVRERWDALPAAGLGDPKEGTQP